MKRKRYSVEQIVAAVKQHELGTPAADIARKLGIAEQTFYRWKKQYGGLEASEVRELKQLREENAKLKKVKVGKKGESIQPVMETHPDLRKALHELKNLLATKECKECVAETVIEELQSLEEEVAMRSAYIKDLINRL